MLFQPDKSSFSNAPKKIGKVGGNVTFGFMSLFNIYIIILRAWDIEKRYREESLGWKYGVASTNVCWSGVILALIEQM